MLKKIALLVFFVITLSSCQFTETLILNEDGSGHMEFEMNMNEMMEFGGLADSISTKTDTIISMRQFLAEKKDSISKLPLAEQEDLNKLENYNIRMRIDSETSEMLFTVFSDFSKIEEANDLMVGMEKTVPLLPGFSKNSTDNGDDISGSTLGITYAFEKGRFTRDVFIKDKVRHQQEVDSMKSGESFMGTMKYKLKYTFPRKIKTASIEDATYSLDGRTIEVERSFLDYFKNPDILDLEIELEH